MGQPITYNVALYLRLSRDDGTDCEAQAYKISAKCLRVTAAKTALTAIPGTLTTGGAG